MVSEPVMETIAISLGPKPLVQGAGRRLGGGPSRGRKAGGPFPERWLARFRFLGSAGTFFSTFPEPAPGEPSHRRPCLSSRTGVRDLGGGAAPPRRLRLAQTEGPDQRLVRFNPPPRLGSVPDRRAGRWPLAARRHPRRELKVGWHLPALSARIGPGRLSHDPVTPELSPGGLWCRPSPSSRSSAPCM